MRAREFFASQYIHMNQDLVDYIRQQLKTGVSKNKITDTLLGQGWQQTDLDEAFAAAAGAKRAPETPAGKDNGFQEIEEDISRPKFGRQAILLAIAGIAALAVLAGVAMLFLPSEKKGGGDTAGGQPTDTPAENSGATTQNETPADTDQIPAALDVDTAALAREMEGLIQPPSGWQEKTGEISLQAALYFMKPAAEKDASGKTIFNEFVNITRGSIKARGAADAAAYLEKRKAALQSKIASYKITSERKIKLAGGEEATLINASFTQNGLAMKNTQLFAFKGDFAYIVTAVVLASNWDKEKDMVGAAVTSFKLPQ